MIEITARTKLCGLLGNPVEHSLSPAIHNAAFQKLGLNYVYLAFRVEDLEGAVRGIRALGNMGGFSVTIPHKVAIIPLLDEVEPTARHIGSVNTIVIDRGRLVGHNTDATGAVRALEAGGVRLKGQHVLILGSGGAARAIAFALAMHPERVAGLTLLGVDDRERRGLAQDLTTRTSVAVSEGALNDDTLPPALKAAQTLIHCTPVGMHPNTGASCVPVGAFPRHLTVMDIVYNPRETKLLHDAKAAGCRTIPGLEMFLCQAVAQFELWTGQTAPADIMRTVLEAKFA